MEEGTERLRSRKQYTSAMKQYLLDRTVSLIFKPDTAMTACRSTTQYQAKQEYADIHCFPLIHGCVKDHRIERGDGMNFHPSLRSY